MAAGVHGVSGQRAVCHVVPDNEFDVESVTLRYIQTVVISVSAQIYRTTPVIAKTAHVNSSISCFYLLLFRWLIDNDNLHFIIIIIIIIILL